MLKKILPSLFFILFVFTGCKKETQAPAEKLQDISVKDRAKSEVSKALWYEFSEGSSKSPVILKKISKPVASGSLLPWTEAVSVTGVGLMYTPPILLVNRAGIVEFSDFDLSEPNLKAFDYLYDRTVDGFYSSNDGTLLRVYRNTLFSSDPILTSDRQAFLCRYNPVSEEIIPLYFPENFGLPKYAQCTHLEKISRFWYLSFKIETKNQVNFAFFKVKSIEKIASAKYSEITKEEFQNALKPVVVQAGEVYSDSDLNIISESFQEFFKSSEIGEVNLIISAPKDLDCKRRFIVKNAKSKSGFKPIDATALLETQGCKIIILTESGVMFFFKDKDGENIIKRLPNLSDGLVYGYFIVSNNRVVAAWNEETFFEIGKTGILSYILD